METSSIHLIYTMYHFQWWGTHYLIFNYIKKDLQIMENLLTIRTSAAVYFEESNTGSCLAGS